jgi:hypothetical protein
MIGMVDSRRLRWVGSAARIERAEECIQNFEKHMKKESNKSIIMQGRK